MSERARIGAAGAGREAARPTSPTGRAGGTGGRSGAGDAERAETAARREPSTSTPSRPRPPSRPPAEAPPRSTRRFWLLVLVAGATAVGLLRFGYKYLEMEIARPGAPLLPPLIDEMTAAWGAALLYTLAIPVLLRFPLTRERWLRRLPVYLALTVAVSVAHTVLNAAVRSTLRPLFGLGAYDYGSLMLRIPMELGNDVVFFWTFVGLVHGFLWYRGLKDREVQTARLQAELSRAQLANLRERIHPHFLFNTLNAISAHMYVDVDAADRMITRLSDLLRAALDTEADHETTLARELELLELYLEIMRLRFGERLSTRIEVADDARDAIVPVLLLQPLVENAIRYGVADRSGPGEVVVRASVSTPAGTGGGGGGGVLRIEVLDDGPGLAGGPEEALRAGVGLSTTAARLRHLHGDAASLTIENRDPTGARVVVTLPFTTRPAGPGGAAPTDRRASRAGAVSAARSESRGSSAPAVLRDGLAARASEARPDPSATHAPTPAHAEEPHD